MDSPHRLLAGSHFLSTLLTKTAPIGRKYYCLYSLLCSQWSETSSVYFETQEEDFKHTYQALAFDPPIVTFFPGRTIDNSDARKERITVRHLASMCSIWKGGSQEKPPSSRDAGKLLGGWFPCPYFRPYFLSALLTALSNRSIHSLSIFLFFLIQSSTSGWAAPRKVAFSVSFGK